MPSAEILSRTRSTASRSWRSSACFHPLGRAGADVWVSSSSSLGTMARRRTRVARFFMRSSRWPGRQSALR